MIKFVNLTPHAITLIIPHGTAVYQSSGLARCETLRTACNGLGSTRLVSQTFGTVTGLPDPSPDTVYIVSALVLSALKGSRPDVVAPDTGPDAVRENGQIVAVRGFVV